MSFHSVVNYVSNMFRPRQKGGVWFYPAHSGVWDEIKYLDAFNSIPELNAIINYKARLFSNGCLKVVNRNGKEVENHWLTKLLQRPNWFQGQNELLRQTKLWHEIFGNEYLYLNLPVGFNAERTKALYSLPPQLIEPELQESGFYFQHTREPKIVYQLDTGGQKVPLAAETIIHLNDNRVSVKKIDDKHITKGESKMKALTPAINNLKMAYESRGIIIKYRGAQGMLSPDSKDGVGAAIPFTESEKKEIQEAYRKNYGTLSNQSQIIITNTAAKWTAMTQNEPRKLGLFDECEQDLYRILDGYGLPDDLFARTKASTYNNKVEARKDVYENTIIPEANEWVTALNARFLPDSAQKLIVDFSHLQIFQEDLKVKSEAQMSKVNVLSMLLQDKQITMDEYREELAKIGIGNGQPIPMERDENQQEVETRQAQATLRGSVGGVQGVLSIQQAVSAGTTTRDSALSMLTIIFGFTDEQANQILGDVNENQNTNGETEQESGTEGNQA